MIDDDHPPSLFAPIAVGSVIARNRLWASPMTQYSAVDGAPTTWHLVHLGSFATGGAGLVMAEATAVTAAGRVTAEDTGLYSEAHVAAWAPVAEFIRGAGAVAGIQLGHAGRKSSQWRPWTGRRGAVPLAQGGWTPGAPSTIPFGDLTPPTALTVGEIGEIVAAFEHGARRAAAAGFEVVELHAAHGYLLHQFLSPLSNDRTDAYGGSLVNRARLLVQVVDAVREAIGGAALFVRVSATDHLPGGWDLEQTVELVHELDGHGVDLYDVSSGGLASGARIDVHPGYQVPYSAELKRRTGATTSAVGQITDAEHADRIVSSGDADALMVGRELLRNPRFPLHAANRLGVELPYWPYQYARVMTRHSHLA